MVDHEETEASDLEIRPCTGKTVELQEDRNLFTRMMVICKSRPGSDIKVTIWIVPQFKDEHISVGRVDPYLCCFISCCMKCMQDDLCVCCFLVTLQIRHISLGPLAFAAIGYCSPGSISFCILDGLFCEVLCLLNLCAIASMGMELFHCDLSDERRWGDSVIVKSCCPCLFRRVACFSDAWISSIKDQSDLTTVFIIFTDASNEVISKV